MLLTCKDDDINTAKPTFNYNYNVFMCNAAPQKLTVFIDIIEFWLSPSEIFTASTKTLFRLALKQKRHIWKLL